MKHTYMYMKSKKVNVPFLLHADEKETESKTLEWKYENAHKRKAERKR